jgi:hypothetical protein
MDVDCCFLHGCPLPLLLPPFKTGHKVYRIAETCLISLSASQQRLDSTASDSTAEKR